MSGVRGAHPGVAGASQFADVTRAAGPGPVWSGSGRAPHHADLWMIHWWRAEPPPAQPKPAAFRQTLTPQP